MERNKGKKTNRGITLIALIITIIVMLILVAVSVRIALTTGIFESAGKATKDWKTSQESEQKIAEGQITIGGVTYNSIEEYTSSIGEKWEVIYDKGETTENGKLFISEDLVFKKIFLYRITVESEEYSGTITTNPMLAEMSVNKESYLLFLTENGNAHTFTTEEELIEKIQAVDSYTIFAGTNEVGKGSFIEMLPETDSEYKIIKIERRENYEKVIFEGELAIVEGGSEIPQFNLEYSKAYELIGTADGKSFSITTRPGPYGIDNWISGGIIYESILTLYGNKIYALQLGEEKITNWTINKIYQIGDSELYKEENGFELCWYEDKWTLVGSPNNEYTVPTTVAGRAVDQVLINILSGVPIFNEAVDICFTGDAEVIEYVIVNVFDEEMVYELISSGVNISNIDMTGCGDSLEFTAEMLSYLDGFYDYPMVYVTEAVKTKYADYPQIQVKSE